LYEGATVGDAQALQPADPGARQHFRNRTAEAPYDGVLLDCEQTSGVARRREDRLTVERLERVYVQHAYADAASTQCVVCGKRCCHARTGGDES
jgi:hypothetical protein